MSPACRPSAHIEGKWLVFRAPSPLGHLIAVRRTIEVRFCSLAGVRMDGGRHVSRVRINACAQRVGEVDPGAIGWEKWRSHACRKGQVPQGRLRGKEGIGSWLRK
eukprot:scaffold142135_cov31-Tisochrysis_lutea.AAC.1